MKYFKYILPVICGIIIFSACDTIDFDHVNKDNDHVSKANTRSLMAAAMNDFFTLTGRVYLTRPTLYVQYLSQHVYTEEMLYNTAPIPWQEYYTDILHPLKKVIEVNSQEHVSSATKLYGAPANQIGVAKLFSAMVWKRLTDLYGPVPFNEALTDSIFTPSYTPQKEIYHSLVSMVKSARDMLNPNKMGPSGDVVYGGNIEKWGKFANSLLLEIAIQMSNVAPNYAQKVFKGALTNKYGVIEKVDQEMWYNYAKVTGSTNPFSGLRGADYYVSYSFVRALKGKADGSEIHFSSNEYDARLNVLVDDPSHPGFPYGRSKLVYKGANENVPNGITTKTTFSSMSSRVQGASAPLPYMTASYTYLNRAEAALLGWTGESVKKMFVKGIEMSYKTIDAHWDDGSPATGDLKTDGHDFAIARWNDASHKQVIAEAKWVSLFPMDFRHGRNGAEQVILN